MKTAMAAIRPYERGLVRRIIEKLTEIPGLTLYGITDRGDFDRRASTAAFTLEGYTPRQVSKNQREYAHSLPGVRR